MHAFVLQDITGHALFTIIRMDLYSKPGIFTLLGVFVSFWLQTQEECVLAACHAFDMT